MPVRRVPLGRFAQFQEDVHHAASRAPHVLWDVFILETSILPLVIGVVIVWFGVSVSSVVLFERDVPMICIR